MFKGMLEMNKDNYWIVRLDPENYRVFTKGANVQRSTDLLNLLRSGKSLPEIWDPVFLNLYQGDEQENEDVVREKNKPVPDFAAGMLGFSVNEKTYSIIKPLISNQVTFLPLNTEVGFYYELDIQEINCVDTENSEKALFSDGKIMRIIQYKFYEDKLEGKHIFKSSDAMLMPIFVSNEFKELVEKNRLTGLTFHPIPLIDE